MDNKVIYIKIHESKGLEWDYVIIADFKQGELPNYYSMKETKTTIDNRLNLKEQNMAGIKKLVMLFYVGFSCVRKGFLVAYSDKIIDYEGQIILGEIGCITSLPFIDIKDINSR